jgi:hypothetical protein
MEKVELSVDLVNGILNYLGGQPFVQVAGLINEIQKQVSEKSTPQTLPLEEGTHGTAD